MISRLFVRRARLCSLRALFVLGCFVAVSVATSARSDPRLNPSISVIADTRGTWSDESDEVSLGLHGAEIAFTGPVNPYASAEVYVGIHEGSEFEIEEAKLSLDRYFPGGFGLVVGRMLQNFGQLNTFHSHAYPFVERPLMHQEFFGEDGVVDTGVRLDWIAPVDVVALRASGGAVRGDLFLGGHGDHGGTEEEADPELGATARVDAFLEVSRDLSFLVGGAILHGTVDPAENARATWIGVDAKGRLDLGPDRVLVMNAEAVFGALDGTQEASASDPRGTFVSVDLRLDRRWNVGAFGESTTERRDDDARTERFGAFLGLALMEETTVFRIVGSTTDPHEGDRVTEIQVQTVFGLGPHRPHRY